MGSRLRESLNAIPEASEPLCDTARSIRDPIILGVGIFGAAMLISAVLGVAGSHPGWPLLRIGLLLMFALTVIGFMRAAVATGEELQQVYNPKRPWQAPARGRRWGFFLFGLGASLLGLGLPCAVAMALMGGMGGIPYFRIFFVTGIIALTFGLFFTALTEHLQRRQWKRAPETNSNEETD